MSKFTLNTPSAFNLSRSTSVKTLLGMIDVAAGIAPVATAAITVTYSRANSNYHTYQAFNGSLVSTLVQDPCHGHFGRK